MSNGPTQVESAERGPLAGQSDEWSERADWRSSVVGSILVTLLAGVWLAASTALLDYAKPGLPLIWGIAIAVLCAIRLLAAPRSRFLALLVAACGAFATLTAFLADEQTGVTANVALIGLIVVVLSLVGIASRTESDRASRA